MKVIEQCIDKKLLDDLLIYYTGAEISSVRYLDDGRLYRIMKHSEYDRENTLPHDRLRPLLTEVLGAHQFTGGHYLDAFYPFPAHFDTFGEFYKRGIAQGDQQLSQDIGIIIPFTENPHCHTVFFDYFLEPGQTTQSVVAIDEKYQTKDNPSELLDLLDHHPDDQLRILSRLGITAIEWHRGDIMVFPRNQLHCSGNFAKHNLTKRGLVLWL